MTAMDDARRARAEAQARFEEAKALEGLTALAGLAERLLGYKHLLDRHGLYLALHRDAKHPAIYLLKRDHSAWARIWFCYDGLRLDADRRDSAGGSQRAFERELTADVDLAAACLVRLLESNGLTLGNWYLPGDLLPIDRGGVLPALPTRARALPAPAPMADRVIAATRRAPAIEPELVRMPPRQKAGWRLW